HSCGTSLPRLSSYELRASTPVKRHVSTLNVSFVRLPIELTRKCRAPGDQVKIAVQVAAQQLTVKLVDVQTWLRDYLVLHSMSVESADCTTSDVSLILKIGPPAHFELNMEND